MNGFNVKVIGKKAKVRYGVSNWFGHPEMEKTYEDHEDLLLWEGIMNSPKLEVNEKLFINEKIVCRIKDIARNVDGGYVCWVDYIEAVEDEYTIKTKIVTEINIENLIKASEESDKEEDKWDKSIAIQSQPKVRKRHRIFK